MYPLLTSSNSNTSIWQVKKKNSFCILFKLLILQISAADVHFLQKLYIEATVYGVEIFDCEANIQPLGGKGLSHNHLF